MRSFNDVDLGNDEPKPAPPSSEPDTPSPPKPTPIIMVPDNTDDVTKAGDPKEIGKRGE